MLRCAGNTVPPKPDACCSRTTEIGGAGLTGRFEGSTRDGLPFRRTINGSQSKERLGARVAFRGGARDLTLAPTRGPDLFTKRRPTSRATRRPASIASCKAKAEVGEDWKIGPDACALRPAGCRSGWPGVAERRGTGHPVSRPSEIGEANDNIGNQFRRPGKLGWRSAAETFGLTFRSRRGKIN